MLKTDVEQMKSDLKEVRSISMNSGSNCCVCVGHCGHSGAHSYCLEHGTAPAHKPALIAVPMQTQLLEQIIAELKDLNRQVHTMKDDLASLRMKYISGRSY